MSFSSFTLSKNLEPIISSTDTLDIKEQQLLSDRFYNILTRLTPSELKKVINILFTYLPQDEDTDIMKLSMLESINISSITQYFKVVVEKLKLSIYIQTLLKSIKQVAPDVDMTPCLDILYGKLYNTYKTHKGLFETSNHDNLTRLGKGKVIDEPDELQYDLFEQKDIKDCECEKDSSDVANYYDYETRQMVYNKPVCKAKHHDFTKEDITGVCKVHGEHIKSTSTTTDFVMKAPGPQFVMKYQQKDLEYMNSLSSIKKDNSEEYKKRLDIAKSESILDLDEVKDFTVFPKDYRQLYLYEKYLSDIYDKSQTTKTKFLQIVNKHFINKSHANTTKTATKPHCTTVLYDRESNKALSTLPIQNYIDKMYIFTDLYYSLEDKKHTSKFDDVYLSDLIDKYTSKEISSNQFVNTIITQNKEDMFINKKEHNIDRQKEILFSRQLKQYVSNSISPVQLIQEIVSAYEEYEALPPTKDSVRKSFVFTFEQLYYSLYKDVHETPVEEYKAKVNKYLPEYKKTLDKYDGLEDLMTNVEPSLKITNELYLKRKEEHKKQLEEITSKNITPSSGAHSMLVIIKDNDVFLYDPNGEVKEYQPTIMNMIDKIMANVSKRVGNRFEPCRLYSIQTANVFQTLTGKNLNYGICVMFSMYIAWLFMVNTNAKEQHIREHYTEEVNSIQENSKTFEYLIDRIAVGKATQKDFIQLYDNKIIMFMKFFDWCMLYEKEFKTQNILPLAYRNSINDLVERIKQRNKSILGE